MIVVLFFLILMILAQRLIEGAGQKTWILFVFISAAGFLTIPIMLYPFMTVVTLFLLNLDEKDKAKRRRSNIKKTYFLAVLVTAVLTAILYLPIIYFNGLKALLPTDSLPVDLGMSFFSQNFLPSMITVWEKH